jgi:hypothetical protein
LKLQPTLEGAFGAHLPDFSVDKGLAPTIVAALRHVIEQPEREDRDTCWRPLSRNDSAEEDA